MIEILYFTNTCISVIFLLRDVTTGFQGFLEIQEFQQNTKFLMELRVTKKLDIQIQVKK